jgi:hypothetical protein
MISKKALSVAAALALVLAAAGVAQGGGSGARYVFRGHLLATPPANATSVSVQVEGGNRLALRTMLGAGVDQSFAVGSGTEFLKWSHGVPTVVHANDLAGGDWVTVNVRAPRGSSLSQVEAQPAGIVSDRVAKPNPPSQPLYLFRGTLAAPAGTSMLSVAVRGGNRRALRLLLGGAHEQSFTFGPETIFLLWKGKVPTVISPAQLTVGDRITVRIRAKRGASLTEVESTAARHVGEHEPATTSITG